MTVRKALAPAKLNFSLEVRPRDGSGLHPVRGLAQSIGWHDLLTLEESDADRLAVYGADLTTGEDNLVWKAVRVLRERTGQDRKVDLGLWKRLPLAAGMAGGSSDAAAALLLYGSLIGADPGEFDRPAALIGADVTFCLYGGLRWIGGYGERLGPPLAETDGLFVVVSVPPFPLDTARVYRAWDILDGPQGPGVAGYDLPPGLRVHGPLRNDLYAAAVACEPLLDDWRAELENRWDRRVLLSGSGPALFSFFVDEREAGEALALVPPEARSAFAAPTIDHGARIEA